MVPEKPSFTVRPCFPEDEEAIRSLCCDTGYLGYPVENIFKDRRWFADFHTSYYLNYEPDVCFVAEADNKIIGYILGCKCPKKFGFIFYPFIAVPLILKAAVKSFTGAYDRKSRDYIKRLVFKGSRERAKRPKKSAHFHFNVCSEYRNKGVGRALIVALIRKLIENGVQSVYGELLHPERLRDESFYTAHGFTIYDRKPTALLGEEFGKVYMMTVTADLKRLKEVFHI